MGRTDGKVAIVTGGARGLGAAQVRALAVEGASVVVADVLADEGARLAGELGDAVRFEPLDVTDAGRWDEVVGAAEEAFGPVSVLVNNAGVVHTDPIETLSEADYRKVIDVNQVGVFLGMKAVLPSMRRAGTGSIVNISSIGGIIAFPGILGYVASKWAVRGMTKAAAQEFGPDGIRVNSVHPGFVGTEMTEGIDVSGMAQHQPLRRIGTPEQLAELVVFLASDASGYCTGSEFVADGGYTSQ
ncbi:glucose 1-dehydrogenase [Saccharopolyspora rosea]|uniref:Glucose 1-dehydrogenase n=1 Tax=Saccharopolyspora rosea TaxID=524884 RepID=A0ABW3FX24_9PSEU|nr:glucose 1-dehydrogenase [Saccharopolyspora rosea]